MIDHAKSHEQMTATREVELSDAAAECRLRKACVPHALELFRLLELARKEFAELPHSLGYEITHLREFDALITKIRSEA